MVKTCFTFILLFVFACSYGQELLKGKLEAKNLEESTVHIINYSRGIGTVNSASGNFEIPVAAGDIIWFTSVQYEKVEVLITKEILESKFLLVRLEESVSELDEVRLSNLSLSGNITRDIAEMKTLNKYALGVPLNTKPLPTKAERDLQSQGKFQLGLATAIPLDLLINSLSGRLKRLKLIKANEDLSLLVEKGIAAFPAEFFYTEFNIPEDDIYNFVHYCLESGNLKGFLGAGKELDLIGFYKAKAKEFLVYRDLD
ncbi:MAG TPA: hypothetical protein VLN72_03665 [Gillisia sp.]|nr:hypothetical protein [Gillisia sp.]